MKTRILETNMKTCASILFIALSVTGLSAQAKTNYSIPKAMQGTWSSSPVKYCKGNDHSRLTVTAKKLKFWESEGKVSSVHKKGNYITVSVTMSGEGETWHEKKRFLLKNNKTLVQTIDAKTKFIRHRCIAL